MKIAIYEVWEDSGPSDTPGQVSDSFFTERQALEFIEQEQVDAYVGRLERIDRLIKAHEDNVARTRKEILEKGPSKPSKRGYDVTREDRLRMAEQALDNYIKWRAVCERMTLQEWLKDSKEKAMEFRCYGNWSGVWDRDLEVRKGILKGDPDEMEVIPED